MERIGANIRVSGIVQGVGFRPFIHKQITDHSLCGFIRNTSKGVEIEIEGEPGRVRLFIDELWTKAPALAVIKDVKAEYYEELRNYTDFRILSSQVLPGRQALISPDVGLCEDCRRELFDPRNRRYRYPFINCTNCGPRYTIVKDVPYDRPLTSMGAFPMCGPCEMEYHDITDRRYHAQPTCCPDCGPEAEYYSNNGCMRTASPADDSSSAFASLRHLPLEGKAKGEAALAEAVKLLEQGGILCVKGLGGMHLACRADQPKSVKELRRRKEREEKPFALMARDIENVRQLCEISPAEEKLLTSRQKPIVLLKKKDPAACPEISENDQLGIMLPYTPLHELLLNDGPPLLIMTSANLSDRPIIKDNDEALRELSDIADGFLLHNRDIVARCDDSLLWELDGEPYFARRSRGWAPEPIEAGLPGPVPSLLACGAEQKASFALSKSASSVNDGGSEKWDGTAQVFLSPHIGEGKNFETLSHYADTIKHYEKLFDIRPQALVCDLHPDYLTTRYAEKRAAAEQLPLIKVQHHHAHMAACLADNGLSGRTLGIIWDGTGYGTDGTVWGGEFLLGDAEDFTRAASLRPFRLPGGDLCSKEIWRVTLSLLTDARDWAAEKRNSVAAEAIDGTEENFLQKDGPMLTSAPAEKTDACSVTGFRKDSFQAVRFQLAQGINTPLTSSIGRLFDGISALLGIRSRSSYEGQAAVLLEAAAKSDIEDALPYAIIEGSDRLLFDERPMTAEICRLLLKGTGTDELAARFMNTLADMAADVAVRIREKETFRQIVLSGGSFQNLYILSRLQKKLEAAGFLVYRHRRVSPNDEGIPLGQLAVGAAKLFSAC